MHLQIQPNVLQGLALRFIDGHGEGEANGKLTPFESKGKASTSVGGNDRYSRDKRNFPIMIPAHNPSFQYAVSHARQNQTGAIAQPSGWS